MCFPTRVLHQHDTLSTNMKNVWFGAHSAEVYVRVRIGWVGEG